MKNYINIFLHKRFKTFLTYTFSGPHFQRADVKTKTVSDVHYSPSGPL